MTLKLVSAPPESQDHDTWASVNMATCFDYGTCDYRGYACVSQVDECVDTYEDLLRDHNQLVREYNELLREHEQLTRDYNRLLSER